jgi:hypothetical protein
MLTVRDEELPQARPGHEVIAGSEEAEQAANWIERKDLPATYVVPDVRERCCSLDGLRTRRDERAVDGPYRGADD